VAAMERPPDERGPVRAWLAAVLRNLRRERLRSDARRDRRETAAALPERSTLPGPDELAARLETARRLAALVADLEEPLRATVLLRFYEGVSSAEIARRTGTPEGTVRWRLHRAMQVLRERLDRESGGERRAWLAAVAPLAAGDPGVPAFAPAAGAPAAATAATGGVLAMATATKAAIGAGVVLAAAGLLWLGNSGRERTAPSGTGSAAAVPSIGSAPPLAGPAELPAPVEDAAPDAASPAAKPSHPEGDRPPIETAVTGRVVTESGAPVRGARLAVRIQEAETVVLSGDDGAFRVDLAIPPHALWWDRPPRPILPAGLTASAPGRETVWRRIELEKTGPLALGDVVLRPGGSVAGRVVDGDGAPVAGAWVGVEDAESGVVPVEERRLWEQSLLTTGVGTTADGAGAYLLAGVAAGPTRLWAGRAGFRAGRSALIDIEASAESAGVEIRVEAERPEDRVEVRVVAPDGTPVPFPSLSMQAEGGGRNMAWSRQGGAGGEFSIPVQWPASFHVLAEDQQGRWGPAFAGPLQPGDRSVVIRLPEKRLLTLRVRSSAGEPIAKWQAHIGHGTIAFGHWVFGVPPGEHADGAARFRAPGFPFKLAVQAEGFAKATIGPFDLASVPDAIECVLEPVAALRGRVVSEGRAVPGARVSARREMPATQKCVRNGLPQRMSPDPEAEATADAEGRFVLALRDRGQYFLRAEVEGSAPGEAGPVPFDPARGAEPVEVRVGAGGAIEGRVLVPPGRSPAGVVVVLNRGDGGDLSATVGEDGRFRFERLLPGPWVLAERDIRTPVGNSTWFGPGTSEFPWNCSVEEGRTTAKDLDLTGAGRALLRGRFGCGEPADARGWSATLLPAGHGFPAPVGGSVVLGADGAFELSAPNPGPWRVRLSSPDGSLQVIDAVDLREGETAWSLDAGLGRVEGRLDPESRWAILWLGPGERWALADPRPAADGSFAVPGMPSGRARLVSVSGANLARDPDPRRWPSKREFEVPAGGSVRIE
ncbi:MAG TPA: sigma-70 family RNA polymerase sigma factor, partial [Planctomycetota bacterium]|nr:sigma-70 family RNA polymerase sigma factor [Planctomycetota bacterium]